MTDEGLRPKMGLTKWDTDGRAIEERTAAALERIAIALEALDRLKRISFSRTDKTGATYEAKW